jgi:hypothetical protein
MATIAVEDMLVPNVYTISYSFRVNTANFEEQNVAFGRIKHLFETRIENSLFINRKHPKWKTLSRMGNNLFVMPCEPMDFPVACALFNKIQAVVEDKFQIVTLQLSSLVGDQVEYLITLDDVEEMNEFLQGMPSKDIWWTESTPNINKLQSYVSWKPVGLEWQSTANKKTSAKVAKVVYFNPDVNVINGGKKTA